jgi:O-antigen ligase
VALKAPIFGHGIGTSAEANWNFRGVTHKSHNLWLEVFQELGVVGLLVFLLYTYQILQSFKKAKSLISPSSGYRVSPFLKKCVLAMNTWLYMNLLFSFASYGLTSYEWYLFGAFSVVITRLLQET